MKSHFLNPIKAISIIVFIASFKLARETNRIEKRAAVWVLPHFVHETLANALQFLMYAEDVTVPIIFLVCNNDTRSRKLLRYYPEMVNYLLKTYATYHSVAKYDTAILHYMQPSNMDLRQ